MRELKLLTKKYGIITATFSTNSATVLSCGKGSPREIELYLEDLADKCDDKIARDKFGIPNNVGERILPSMIRGIASSFNNEVFPLSDEIICFIAIDDRFPNPYLWRSKNVLSHA